MPDNLLFTAKSKLDSLNDNDFLATKIKSFFAKEFHYENILKYSGAKLPMQQELMSKGKRWTVECIVSDLPGIAWKSSASAKIS